MIEHLSDVRPSYGAEFIIENSDKKGDLRLCMAWTESDVDDNGKVQFAEVEKKWTRLDRHTGTTTRLLDVSLLDLTKAGSTWQLDITSAASEDVTRLPMNFQEFPQRVKINPSIALQPTSNRCFIEYNPSVKPKSLRQTIRYQYMITGTDYTLELSQYQDRKYVPKEKEVEEVVDMTRWSLNVFRIEWDNMFEKNQSLKIGTQAEWKDEIQEWFPKDWEYVGPEEDGFVSLMDKLGEIEKRIRDAGLKREELL